MVKDKKQYLYNKNVQIFSLCLKYREGEKMNYIKKLKIGNVELENNLILAPMAGVTNQPFRIITKKIGNPRFSMYRNGKCKSNLL